jgi:spore protease
MEKNVYWRLQMEKYIRTDLACELRGGGLKGEQKVSENVGEDGFRVIKTGAAEQGSCVTVICGNVGELDDEEASCLALCVARELGALVKSAARKKRGVDFRVLVAGLGNASMTADAIGPSVTSRVTVTGHLAHLDPELFEGIGCCRIYAVTPGVLGETGMEALELIRGAVEAVSPDLVVAVDALAARSIKRLNRTIQITDTGIWPGSGVGNHRRALSKESMGVPVIAIGVPTVVDAATIVSDAVGSKGDEIKELSGFGELGNMYVTSKDIDGVLKHLSFTISEGLNIALDPGEKL